MDALIDNGRRGRPVTGPGNRPLKSLSDMLKGKQGRFRQNLLGKRVDYSGRSVIVVGPNLKMYQCGLPKEMALELFKPFVMKKLVEEQYAHNIKSAKRMVERVRDEVWDVLEGVIKEHPVLLNRAPTLHRLGIQAFEPVLVEGRAIQIHPLVCSAYNADFDGDQMAVHVPLSAEAQAEARILMLSSNNILNPKDGAPVVTPTQDIVMGCYYMTLERPGAKGEGSCYTSPDEAMMAYQLGLVDLHAKVTVRWNGRRLETTVGRVVFNEKLPEDLRFVNRVVDKKGLDQIIALAYHRLGNTATSQLLDEIKQMGFKFATRAGTTIGVMDLDVPVDKDQMLQQAEREVEQVEQQYRRGLLTAQERYERIVSIWTRTKDGLTEKLVKALDPFNPIYMMITSGARGSFTQLSQLAGMRGLMTDPTGRTIEEPVRASFREGLTVLEYFTSTHGTRKGLADTALRTADSGYLTRRLVDVSQDVIVREEDCGTPSGVTVSAIRGGNEVIEGLADRIIGRVLARDVLHPQTGEVLAAADSEVDEETAAAVEGAGVEEVEIRSVFSCRCRFGVCAKCYGRNLATGHMVDVGEAVGIIAAQSIGEPGTQLTMRTFHLGGVAGDDITQGLPRVEELFEARKPKGQAVIAEADGAVEITEARGKREVRVRAEDGTSEVYVVPFGARLRVRDGDQVVPGDELTEGSINPHDILKIKGIRGVQGYLLQEVQRVYRLQGVDINDKHIEIIIRQMLRKVKVDEPGDTDLLPGGLVDMFELEDENTRVGGEGGRAAQAKPVLLGITKASLATDSFLSAASFQETTRVLTDASIKGKRDPLLGLKENVIIGKLIPAGTGMGRYRNIRIWMEGEEEEAARGAAEEFDGVPAASTIDDDEDLVPEPQDPAVARGEGDALD